MPHFFDIHRERDTNENKIKETGQAVKQIPQESCSCFTGDKVCVNIRIRCSCTLFSPHLSLSFRVCFEQKGLVKSLRLQVWVPCYPVKTKLPRKPAMLAGWLPYIIACCPGHNNVRGSISSIPQLYIHGIPCGRGLRSGWAVKWLWDPLLNQRVESLIPVTMSLADVMYFLVGLSHWIPAP